MQAKNRADDVVSHSRKNNFMNAVVQYYRCPRGYVSAEIGNTAPFATGYFRFGSNTVCYGQHAKSKLDPTNEGALYDALVDTKVQGDALRLPFDPDQVIDNLRGERYVTNGGNGYVLGSTFASLYYFMRPWLPLRVRKNVLRAHLHWRRKLHFPRWPVDTTVDRLCGRLLALLAMARGVGKVPFIWFWPEGATSCVIMTHDVETKRGRDYCDRLMDIDDSFEIPASFQLIPEERYAVPGGFLDLIKSRGFEVNVQDLNHDGLLFRNRQQFLERSAKINSYGQQFGAVGFRSAILYRRQEWLDALAFEYDMSVPNVAHLDPQSGGCCTVMPYFVGSVLELPVTTAQDYSLFYILNEYSLDLWKRQIDLIMQNNGLVSFIVHPDYIVGERELRVYRDLLSYLARLRTDRNVWIAKPGDVNHWWRQRMQMTLVEKANGWHVEGLGSERARIAYAAQKNDQLEITLETAQNEHRA